MNLKFELITTKAFKCKRFDFPGANTDLYDNLNLSNPGFDTYLRLGKIVSALDYALHQVFADGLINDNEFDTFHNRLTNMGVSTLQKSHLDSFVDDLLKLFVQKGL